MGFGTNDSNDLKKDKKLNEFLWSDAYLIIAEEKFDEVFKHIYEHELIDKIFPDIETLITREEFTKNVAGTEDVLPKSDWLFSTLKLRNIFMNHIEFGEYKDIIDQYL